MKTITLELREDQSLYDKNGSLVFYWGDGSSWQGLDQESQKSRLEIKEVSALKDAGFDAKEIIEMHKAGVV